MDKSEDRTAEICRRICSLADELRDIWLRHLSRKQMREILALTVSQKRMFRTVWRMTEQEPVGVTLKALAGKLSLSSSAASVMVDSMVRLGVLERKVDERDRRKVFIRVSDSGRAQARAHIAGVAAGAGDFFAGLTESQVEAVSGVLGKFQQFLIASEKENAK